MRKYDTADDAAAIKTLREQGTTIHGIIAAMGPDWSYRRVQQAAKYLADNGPVSLPTNSVESYEVRPSARSRHIIERNADLAPGRIHRFLVSYADPASPDTWFENLCAYAVHIGADLLLGGKHKQLKHYSDELRPYVVTDRIRLSDSLLFIGDPGLGSTTGNPLDKFITANHGQHIVIPSPRVSLKSIPRMSCFPARYAMSTGAVTVPEYDRNAAGQSALFHHTAAALLVEIDTDGEAFFRQIIAAPDGSFQDMDTVVADGRVTEGNRVHGIVWADVHHDVMNHAVGLSSFGYDRAARRYTGCENLLDTLAPEWQVMADVLNFSHRHRHVRGNSTELARQHYLGQGDVYKEVYDTARFINLCRRDWSSISLIEDNHGAKFADWVDQDNRKDPLPRNARYWAHMFERKMAMLEADPKGYRAFQIVEAALREAGLAEDVGMVYRGESFAPGGVETAVHSHKGINGSPGNPSQFRGFGTRITITHPHTPMIDQGMMSVGTCADIPEAWDPDSTTHAHAHGIHYGNGKRCLLTMAADGRWRAVGDRMPTQAAA